MTGGGRAVTFSVITGLVPVIDVLHGVSMRQGHVYIMTNRPHGVLYVGVTSDLSRRVHEHRKGTIPGFTARYGLRRLVYAEAFELVTAAIQREKNIKHWPRRWKINLVESMNPDWNDLAAELL
jgi:putative endonuclease